MIRIGQPRKDEHEEIMYPLIVENEEVGSYYPGSNYLYLDFGGPAGKVKELVEKSFRVDIESVDIERGSF